MKSPTTASFDSFCVVFGVAMVMALASVAPLAKAIPVDEYMRDRSLLLQADRSVGLGSRLVLTKEEQVVSNFLVKEKKKLIEKSRLGGYPYYPSQSFFKAKPFIDKSLIYQTIRKMPKGAALHLHDQAITSLDWLVKNATYRDDLYMCLDKNISLMVFRFFKTPSADCSWISVSKARAMHRNVSDFDASLKKNLSLLASDPFVTYPSITEVWGRFQSYFLQVFNIIFYEPVFREYFKQALKEFHEDNVQYIELRGGFQGIYDLKGKIHKYEHALLMYRNVTEEFVKENPDFSGAKFILSSMRKSSKPVVLEAVKVSNDLHQRYPKYMLGYDLVGQEDPNYSLLHYRDELLYPQQNKSSSSLPYFFHAGETNWQGTATDYNLVDAILLNTSRIGHGYALPKHPKLVDLVKTREIAVEVNPISNQLLGLVKDLRNHALVPLMKKDFPVVISSDDPATWEATPLSHDFYLVFMNMCGEDDDLRVLKQLAINSIKYSSMTEAEKEVAMTLWKKKWQIFISDTIKSFKVNGYQQVKVL